MIIGLLAILAAITVGTVCLLMVDYKRAKKGDKAAFWERKEK